MSFGVHIRLSLWHTGQRRKTTSLPVEDHFKLSFQWSSSSRYIPQFSTEPYIFHSDQISDIPSSIAHPIWNTITTSKALKLKNRQVYQKCSALAQAPCLVSEESWALCQVGRCGAKSISTSHRASVTSSHRSDTLTYTIWATSTNLSKTRQVDRRKVTRYSTLQKGSPWQTMTQFKDLRLSWRTYEKPYATFPRGG